MSWSNTHPHPHRGPIVVVIAVVTILAAVGLSQFWLAVLNSHDLAIVMGFLTGGVIGLIGGAAALMVWND